YIVRLVGSRSTKAVEQLRADLALDWLVRTHTATWLAMSPALAPHADEIRALPPLTSIDALRAAQPILDAARAGASQAAAAWDAARAAAGAAARAAAWDAARAAARAAAWDAARAAARAAAWAAAWDAARAAARAAAWD